MGNRRASGWTPVNVSTPEREGRLSPDLVADIWN